MNAPESPLPQADGAPAGAPASTTTAEEMAALRALSEELANAETSPWQPRCICDAFAPNDGNFPAPRFVLTMERWIALERVKSPVLARRLPDTTEELEQALRAFGYMGPSELEIHEWTLLAEEMVTAIEKGFSTVLAMRPKDDEGQGERGGFGAWAPLFTCLVTQAGLTPAIAMAMPVEQANILLATMRWNQGWEEVGTPYAIRDLGFMKAEENAE